VARAPPPANRRKHRNCWAGWPTLFVDIIQLRPPRSSRFSKAGDSGCGYLGVLISYAAERIIPSHIPNDEFDTSDPEWTQVSTTISGEWYVRLWSFSNGFGCEVNLFSDWYAVGLTSPP